MSDSVREHMESHRKNSGCRIHPAPSGLDVSARWPLQKRELPAVPYARKYRPQSHWQTDPRMVDRSTGVTEKVAQAGRNRNLEMNQSKGKKKISQSPPPGACANYPPPTSHPAGPPVLPALAARSSLSQGCGSPDSPAVIAVWMRARPYPRSRSLCRYSALQFRRRELPWRAPVRAPEIVAPGQPHPPGWHGSRNSLCRSEPRSNTKRLDAVAEGSAIAAWRFATRSGRGARRKKPAAAPDEYPAGPFSQSSKNNQALAVCRPC